MNKRFDTDKYRSYFPALRKPSHPIFLDAVGGTQVPDSVINAVTDYFINKNGNKGGVFPESRATDEVMQKTREITADFINAKYSSEIIFGPNYTTNTFAVSRAISATWEKGDEVIVTRLDHDANVSPWVRAAEDKGVTIRYADITDGDLQINMDAFSNLLSSKTKLVAFCAASSSVGTRTDVKTLTNIAQRLGALVYVDAVAYAPHGPIDVQEWGADFVGISVYKFFGPHVGLLWGKKEHLMSLPAYKIRPSPDTLPEKWMIGAQSYETLAGAIAAMEYLELIGLDHPEYNSRFPNLKGRKLALKSAMTAIQEYERELTWKFIEEIKKRPRWKIWGIKDKKYSNMRIPTIAISLDNEQSNDIALHLAKQKINIWSRSIYSVSLSERLGLENKGGFIRVGFAHYNTFDEIDRLLVALDNYKK